MKRILQEYWTAAIPLAVLLLIVAVLVHLAAKTETGSLVYPVDDAYIHMALAKNLAAHGNWALRSDGFDGASSSPLWTLLLAALCRLGAPGETTPLFLNLIFGCCVVFTIYFAAIRRQWPTYWTLSVTLAVVIWCPLFANVFSGMEHTLQVLLTLLLFTFAGEYAAAGKSKSTRWPWHLMLLAPLATATRYEDCFLVFAICVVLAFQKRWPAAVAIAAAGALPIAAYAIYSLSQGGLWAPNSVLVKAWGLPIIIVFAKYTLIGGFLWQLVTHAHYIIPLILVVPAVYLYQRPWRTARPSAVHAERRLSDAKFLFPIWALTTVLHFDLAGPGWYYRYEAYTLAMGLFTLGALIAPSLPQRIRWSMPRASGWIAVGLGMLSILMCVTMTRRSVQAIVTSAKHSRNIQQYTYLMASFVRDLHPTGAVAINDIGAVLYYTDARIVDLCGLASIEVARQILRRTYDTAAIDYICQQKGVEIAIVCPCGYYKDVPKSWIPVATWTIPNHLTGVPFTLSFYAVQPQLEERIRAKLLAFAPRLPPEVHFALIERLAQ